ncbi:universal stress protein [Halobacteriales archaeon Cl-PHB]
MSIVVPFDGCELSQLALRRARIMADAFQTPVHAVTIIPRGSDYAREQGWLEADEPFDGERIAERLRHQVAEIAPEVTYHSQQVNSRLPRGSIAKRIRRFAQANDANVVFIGSENAGRVVTPISSVGGSVAADEDYDVYVIRNQRTYLADKV